MATINNTRVTLRREMVETFGLGIARLTATGGSGTTGTFTDSRITYAAIDTRNYQRAFFYRPGAAAADQVRSISAIAVAAGVITITHDGAAYSVNPASGDDCEIHFRMDPNELQRGLDRAMDRVYIEQLVPLTRVTDGDMEASGVTNWTDISGLTPTQSKATAAASVFMGAQSLRVLNDAANEGVESAAINVFPGEPFFCGAFVRLDTAGTARLRLWNETNSAAIDTETTSERDWAFVWFTGDTPSTARQVRARLIGDGAAEDPYWDSVIFFMQAEREMELPSWVVESWQVRKVYEVRSLDASPMMARAIFDRLIELRGWRRMVEQSALTVGRLRLNGVPSMARPLFVLALRQASDIGLLTAETTQTDAPKDWLFAEWGKEVFKPLAQLFPDEMVVRGRGEVNRWDDLHDKSAARAVQLSQHYIGPATAELVMEPY